MYARIPPLFRLKWSRLDCLQANTSNALGVGERLEPDDREACFEFLARAIFLRSLSLPLLIAIVRFAASSQTVASRLRNNGRRLFEP